MSAETRRERIVAVTPRGRQQWLRARARFAWRFLTARFSSSLTRRIVVLNLGGLVVLMIGFLLLNQFRADIIAARVQSLTTQANIISAAIAASAAVDTDTITVDPDKLLQLAPGQTAAPPSDEDAIQFSINPERVGPVLHRLVTPTHTRARIYDSDGRLLLDSRSLSAHGAVVRSDLPDTAERRGLFDRLTGFVRNFFAAPSQPRARDPWLVDGKSVPEVAAALKGQTQSAARINDEGETIVSVAVPIQYMMATRGALQLSTQGGDIDRVIASERWAILRFFVGSGRGHAGPFAVARQHHRRAGAPARRRRRAGEARHPFAPADSRFHFAVGRNRPSFARSPRNDAGALQSPRRHRELRCRCRARAEEPADVVAQRARDASAGEGGPLARPVDRGHAARRAAARPTDLRHFRRFSPGRGTGARRSWPGRRRSASARRRLDGAGFAAQQRGPDRAVDSGSGGAGGPTQIISCWATIRAWRRS